MNQTKHPQPVSLALPDEAATLALASRLASTLQPPALVFLHGDLGAGKTALVRGFLRALGVEGPVKSPTYSLIESYQISPEKQVHHLDLYRLGDPEELAFLGFEELHGDGAIVLIEWPEKGAGFLPNATHDIRLDYAQVGRIASLSGDF